MSGARLRWGVTVAVAVVVTFPALLGATGAGAPFRGGEYRVAGEDAYTYLLVFRTSRDLRWVTSSVTAQYQAQNCRLAGRRVSFWIVFPMPRRISLTRDGRFAKTDAWPRLSGRFSSDGSKLSVRLWNRALTFRRAAGTVRCPAVDHRFEALIHLPAGEYVGTTAQGKSISFTLGGARRTSVSNLAFSATLACDPAGSVAHTYSGLSGTVDVAGSPKLEVSTGSRPFGGGVREGFVHATWLGATVSGRVSAEWLPPEPDPEDDTSPLSCETPEDGIPFTARLVGRNT